MTNEICEELIRKAKIFILSGVEGYNKEIAIIGGGKYDDRYTAKFFDDDNVLLKRYCYDNAINESVEIKNGKKHGREITYHSNGNIWLSLEYENGIESGAFMAYDINGNMYFYSIYKDGKFVKRLV